MWLNKYAWLPSKPTPVCVLKAKKSSVNFLTVFYPKADCRDLVMSD
jgi:hypothetical protein